MNVLQTKLAAARDLLLPRGAWIRGAYARRAEGGTVLPTSKYATCFCAIGAAKRVGNGNSRAVAQMMTALRDALNYPETWKGSVEGFNDGHTTRKRDVIALYNRAIKLSTGNA